MKIEYETNLNHASMHIFTEDPYEEDYQIQMLRQNKIEGILSVEGCEIEGKSRYTYDIGGFISMQKVYEKRTIKKEELKNLIQELLDTSDRIQKYMLEPNCLILNSECIFQKQGHWYFCYLPGKTKEMNKAFHLLSEYFVKIVDYGDTEAVLLAYELHKASFQEHYNLRLVMEEYERKGKERDHELKKLRRNQKVHESIFRLEDEGELDELIDSKKEFAYNLTPVTASIRETQGPWQYRVRNKKDRQSVKQRWGAWEDLILECEDQSGR